MSVSVKDGDSNGEPVKTEADLVFFGQMVLYGLIKMDFRSTGS